MALRTVLVGLDLTARSDLAYEAALAVAERHRAERVHLVHVIDAAPLRLSSPEAELGRARESLLRGLMDRAWEEVQKRRLRSSGATITADVRVGDPARELVAIADELSAELIVIATDGYGRVSHAPLGRVASTVSALVTCPVLRVGRKCKGTSPFAKILACVDLSQVSVDVLGRAIEFAERDHGQVTVVSVFEPPLTDPESPSLHLRSTSSIDRTRRAYLAALDELAARFGPNLTGPKVELADGRPVVTCLLESITTHEPDLVVLGSTGRSAWTRMLLGSTASKIIPSAPCPVLIVPNNALERPAIAPLRRALA